MKGRYLIVRVMAIRKTNISYLDDQKGNYQIRVEFSLREMHGLQKNNIELGGRWGF